MKSFVKLGFVMLIAMAFVFMGCKQESEEPEPITPTSYSVDISICPTLWASDHEVTQTEYQSVMGTNPSHFKDNPASGETQGNRPVECVSWYDCLVYCNKKSIAEGFTPCYTIDGKTNPNEWGDVPRTSNTTWNEATCNFETNGYRLPTEVEWEYLARGGNLTNSGQTTYSGSDTIDDVAWYISNSENKTHEVKKKSPNALGLYDMTGNVAEWCWDSKISTNRVCRGASFINPSAGSTLSMSSAGLAYSRSQNVGFRVVRSTQE